LSFEKFSAERNEIVRVARHKRAVVAGSLITVGLGFIGLLQAEPYLDRALPFSVPDWVYEALAVVGVVCVAVGGMVWLFVTTKLPIRRKNYECYPAARDQLPLVHEIATRYFGDDVSTLETMNRWWVKNPEIFFLLARIYRGRQETNEEIVGYFCVVPLTKRAENRLRAGDLRGSQFEERDIASGPGRCAAVYIGALVAEGKVARGNLTTLVHYELATRWRKRAARAYTRPVTPDGLRLARKYKFSAVQPGIRGDLGDLFVAELAALEPQRPTRRSAGANTPAGSV
jgi:hypothetical protein